MQLQSLSMIRISTTKNKTVEIVTLLNSKNSYCRLGWVAGADQMNQNQWIRAEFNELFKISAIQTQGRAFKREIHFTKSYKVSYSKDGVKWNVYSDMHGSEKVDLLF